MRRSSRASIGLGVAVLLALGACAGGGGGTNDTGGGAQSPAGGSGEDAGPRELEKFTYILDFLPNGEHLAYFAALDQGWYEEEGLDVEIIRGNGSGDTVSRVAAGEGDAGNADFSAIVASIANQDAPVVAIGSYLRRPPHSIFMREGGDITEPKDLEGKTVGTTAGNSNQILFPLFAKLAGFDDSKVKWTTMDAASLGPALITGSVDASVFYSGHMPRVAAQAAEQNVELFEFPYAEYGIEVYSLSMFARTADVEDPEKADKLKRFIRASQRGLEYITENEDNMRTATEKIVSLHPEVDFDAVFGAAKVYHEYVLTEEIVDGSVKWMEWEPERVEYSRDIYNEYLELDRVVDVEDIYTNDLIS